MRLRSVINSFMVLGLACAFACVEKKMEDAVEDRPPAPDRKTTLPKDASGAGCWHTIEPGQSLWRICKAYNVDMERVAKINHISDPTQISAGQKIFIPGAAAAIEVEPFQPQRSDTAEPPGNNRDNGREKPDTLPPVYSSAPGKLLWPVPDGKIFSSFGSRGDQFHEGIDISTRSGTQVFAADDGKIVYSSAKIRGYGNMIVIKHAGNLSTVYAHNRVNLVKEGDFVRKGDKIAEVGQTGKASGPHLHFEVRAGKSAVDPLKYVERRK